MTIATNRGYQFEAEIGRTLKKYTQFSFKLPDSRAFGFIMSKTGYPLPKVPCDFIAVHKSQAYFIECKQTKNTAIRFNAFRPHQIEALDRVAKAGGNGLFFINFNNRERTKAKKINKLYILDVINLKALIKTNKAKGRMSIPREDFDSSAFLTEKRLKMLHGYGWDLNWLFEPE